MTYQTSVSQDGKFISVKVQGIITRVNAMQMNQDVHAFGRLHGLNRYLLDLTESTNSETAFGNYNFAYEDMKAPVGIDRNARVAMLVEPEDHSHDFVEIVSRNSGLDVALFRDRESALNYLLQKVEPNVGADQS